MLTIFEIWFLWLLLVNIIRIFFPEPRSIWITAIFTTVQGIISAYIFILWLPDFPNIGLGIVVPILMMILMGPVVPLWERYEQLRYEREQSEDEEENRKIMAGI